MAKVNLLDVPVEFGGVSIGDATARLGIRMSRNNVTLETADECFCEHRLDVDVILGRDGDQSGQQTLVDDLEFLVTGSADVKRIGVTSEQITSGLTFSLKDIDVAELARFSKGTGRLIVHQVGAIPEAEPKHDKAAKAQRVDGPFRAVPVLEVFAPGQANALTDFGIDTFGEYLDRKAKLGIHWYDDIPRIGATVAAKMEEAEFAFWAKNPQGDEGDIEEDTDEDEDMP